MHLLKGSIPRTPLNSKCYPMKVNTNKITYPYRPIALQIGAGNLKKITHQFGKTYEMNLNLKALMSQYEIHFLIQCLKSVQIWVLLAEYLAFTICIPANISHLLSQSFHSKFLDTRLFFFLFLYTFVLNIQYSANTN